MSIKLNRLAVIELAVAFINLTQCFPFARGCVSLARIFLTLLPSSTSSLSRTGPTAAREGLAPGTPSSPRHTEVAGSAGRAVGKSAEGLPAPRLGWALGLKIHGPRVGAVSELERCWRTCLVRLYVWLCICFLE